MLLLSSTVHQQASKPLTGDAGITVCILQEEKTLFCQNQEASLCYKWDMFVDLTHQSTVLPYTMSCRLCQLCKLAVRVENNDCKHHSQRFLRQKSK